MTRERLSKSDRERQIKQAAVEVFTHKGFSGSTMEEIIAKTGLSKGGVYHYYSGKEEILIDLIRDANTLRRDLVRKYMRQNEGMERKELIVNMLLNKIMDNNPLKMVYIIFLTELNTNEKFINLYEEIVESSKREFIEFCNEEELPEYIKLTNEVFNIFINSMLLGTNILKMDDEEEVRTMLRIMVEAYMSHLEII